MPEPTDDIPDYLPDGTINIHGKLALPFRIYKQVNKRGEEEYIIRDSRPTVQQMKKRLDDDLDKAYNGQ
ncbi:hypothetical protein WBJ53_30570 [Spirosoma sp. SC4-14]|uniref:hypothetical protein n=1 Tax=Spirosoma sp. SC4-14 TaxID=3128900 RepID=UPI0030CDA998